MDWHHRKSYTSCESQIANTKKFLCITVINLAVKKGKKKNKVPEGKFTDYNYST